MMTATPAPTTQTVEVPAWQTHSYAPGDTVYVAVAVYHRMPHTAEAPRERVAFAPQVVGVRRTRAAAEAAIKGTAGDTIARVRRMCTRTGREMHYAHGRMVRESFDGQFGLPGAGYGMISADADQSDIEYIVPTCQVVVAKVGHDKRVSVAV